MKKKAFIVLFLTVHVLFIALQIDKQSRMIKLSYTKQKKENALKTLFHKKQALVNELYRLKNKQEIKAYAHTHLKMKPLKIKQVQRIPGYGQHS
ncbi:MAG: Tfp pilus assembly protein PilO [Alteromonas naphthalenivorans]|jgi:Tfp pilus assembly protein PilO